MIDYIKQIIITYVVQTRAKLKLSSDYPALVLFDVFKQLEDKVQELVDMRLSALSAKWIIETCQYLSANSTIIVNGFRAAGIVDALK